MNYYRCIGGSGGSEKNTIADFDYTSSLIDSIRALTGVNTNCTQSENGLYFPTNNANIKYDMFTSLWKIPNTTIELDVGNGSISYTSNNNRLIMWSTTNGLVYRANQGWAVYNDSWSNIISNDKDFFNNSTIKLETLSNNKVAIYKDNVKIDEYSLGSTGVFTLGASSNSCNGMYIKALRLYM